MAHEQEEKTSAPESAKPQPGSAQSATETTENVQAKEESVSGGAAVPEVAEEVDTTTSVTDQVKEKILEVAAPVTAAAAAATAAVTDFFGTGTEDSSPIPGTFPDTPAEEKTEASTSAPMLDEVKKTENEPVPGAVVPSEVTQNGVNHASDEKHNLETVALETGAGAVAAGGFAAALAADKAANTAPSASHIPSAAYDAAPAKNDSFGILPVPSETAPEGTKPLAKTVYSDTDKTADVGSLVPEPVKDKEVPSVPESKAFEPVTSETNIIHSAGVSEPKVAPADATGAAAVATGAVAAASAAETTATSTVEELKSAALQTSNHAAQTAAKALSEDVPTPAELDPKVALGSLASGAGATAIGTATDHESNETGLSRLVARKENDKVDVEAEAKAAEVEPAIVLDETKMGKPNVETLGTSGSAAVASTPVKVSVPTQDGVQEVAALGTAIVTDAGESSQSLKAELLDSGKGTLPAGALAHLSKPEETKATETSATETTKKETSATPQKTAVSQSSASKKDNRTSMSPSEPGSEKKKKGFRYKLKKFFS